MEAELQDGISEFEHLGDDAGALADAHAGQDGGETAGQLVGSGEVGVQGEAGCDALQRMPVGHVVGVQPTGVGGEYEELLGPGADERVGPPQDVDALVARCL